MHIPLLSQRLQLKLLLASFIAMVFLGYSAFASAQCSSPANAIVAENCLTGNPSSEWDVSTGDAGSLAIQGFATDISVTPGNTIYFKINTPSTAYTINIYRIGYYQGNGARKIATIVPSVSLPQTQPACISDAPTGLTDCGNWGISASWTVPATAVSGVYVAHLVRSDATGDSHIVFVVRNDSSHSAVLYQTSDPTWQAYNYYGNGSLYGPGQPVFGLSARSFAASYNRPALTRGFNNESATWFFGAEFAMVQWLESNGYDVSYFTGLDADRNGSLIKNHKLYMDSGHDEYVSPGARTNIQAARDAGVNLAFFSGNEVFWKIRFANSSDGSNTPYRTVVCYKETLAFAKIDPGDPPTWTGTWRDPTFSPPADGGLPENQLTGTLFMVNGTGDDNDGSLKIQVPQTDGQMRFWRNTAAATLAPGATYSAVQGSLGYEWDEDVDNGFRPAGAFHLSTSTYSLTTDLLLDYGATYGAGTATHHMMMYRAPSGALVFGAGTVDWAYGLNGNHDQSFEFTPPNPDINMQQATMNLFADMGVQPGSIQPGLVPATASTDTTPPQSAILSPASGAGLNTGSTVNITGTASDTGGVVAGVEFSGDGGVTWHPATGRTSWSYAWTPAAAGTVTLLSRAVDDSGNIETPRGSVTVSISPQTCPCTIFEQRVPSQADSGDSNSLEVGVKFRADSDGSIVGVRFYKAAANTGTHVGHVWTDSGQLLGTATFTSETATGWQQANFSSPIAATANTSYVVSYFAPNGHYSNDAFFFETANTDNPPLHALENGVDGTNALFTYGSMGAFPTSSYNASNYWVDVVYTSTNTFGISGTVSGNGGGGATVTLTGPESLSTSADGNGNFSFNGVVNGSYSVSVTNPGVSFAPASQSVIVNFASVTGVNFVATVANPLSISGILSGGGGATVTLAGPANIATTADSSGNYSFGGLLGGAYTVTPSLANYIFSPSTQNVTLSGSSATGVNFSAQVCDCVSIFSATATPATIDSGDTKSTEVGVLFRADATAYLTGIRFYKASTNTGTHIGHLWSQTGQLLATATFPGETASGWQQGYFSAPVLINAATPYIASYLAPSGHYSASSNYFATAGVDNPPLHALQNGVSGPDGVYIYTANGAFPTNSFQATNYWVDVLYAAQPYTISGTVSGPGGPGATVNLSGSGQATTTADSNGNFTFNGVFGGSYTVTPSGPNSIFLPGSQNVTVSQSNITGINFSVPALCPCNTLWQSSIVPTSVDSGDPASLEVGTKMRLDQDGYVLGVRFYKAATNTGTHIGNLWSSTSTTSPLASATFVNESASGWQQVIFGSPVPVKANTTYITSYFTPAGHYAADGAFFTNAGVDSPPIHGLQTGVDGPNGVFSYGALSSYPANSYNADNYWVDLIYSKTGTYTIAGIISGPGGPGATVTLSGAGSATATADGNGNYSFNGLINGNYVVTPNMTGFTYVAASQSITVSGAHSLGVNFGSAVTTYSITGNVAGAPGIAVTLTGSSTITTTADASGNYTFPSVPNGTYTVTPSGLGYSVSPASQTVAINSTIVNSVNFVATVLTYSISGTINGGAGATVNLIGPTTVTTTADLSGAYNFTGVTVGNYTILPSMTGSVFSPANINTSITTASLTNANFAVPSNCPCDTIWAASAVPGTADSGDGNSVEVGVKFTASADAYIAGIRFYKAGTNIGIHQGNLWSTSGTLLGTATFQNESASGWQQVLFAAPVPVQANVTYVASYFAPSGHYAADLGYFLNSPVNSPPLQALQNTATSANGLYVYSSQSAFPNNDPGGNAMNYWVDVIYTPTSTYTVAGNVSGSGGPGATLTLGGTATATTMANSQGNFAFNGLANGSYSVTPSQSSITYSPVNLNASINNGHALGLSFSSTGGGFEISGTIAGPGGPGATVSLTGVSTITTTADGTGSFAFTGLVNGAYTVSVSNSGYTFTPTSQPVTLNGVNSTITFSSGAQIFSVSGTISGLGGSGATVTLSGAASATATANTSGTFTFTGLANGSYTVAVANTGFVFTPASQAVTVSNANAAANFSSAAQTYSITGSISGAGGNGATVTLSGAASATTTSSGGSFSFTGLTNGSYTVAVANIGFVFTPASQAVAISNANAAANFSSAAQTYSITGSISGTGGSGATVTLGGAGSATVAANSLGAYTFSGLINGSYTVTPAKTGYVFTPVTQAVVLSGANATANFTSVATHTLSGTITGTGGNGATVALSGSASATTTANASGVYSFTVVNGTYTVTPSKSGFVMTPTSRSVTVNGTNIAVPSFSSAVQSFTLSGTITGGGGNGATVTLSGAATATTTANSSGGYSFTGLANGSYAVTPSKSGYSYSPVSTNVTVAGANATANFSSALLTYTISGTITGAGGNGATVKLSGTATATATANASGAYTFSGITNGSYIVTPTKAAYLFSPTSTNVTVAGANATANFSSALLTYTISGTITGVGGNGATVKLSGTSSATTTANSSGAYSFAGLANGSYTVTPSKTGYVMSPTSRSVVVSGANIVVPSISSAAQTFTISGTITGAGGFLATVNLSGSATATVTTNLLGAYSFTGIANGNYTITPSRSGHIFTPNSRSATVSGANVTVPSFSSN